MTLPGYGDRPTFIGRVMPPIHLALNVFTALTASEVLDIWMYTMPEINISVQSSQ